eukprot:4345501-Karenia_brevis.AAC.1
MQLTGLDPELRTTGGVGTIGRKKKFMTVKPLTDGMKALVKMGRANITAIPIPGTIIMCINVYGWTNGHHSEQASRRTDDMMSTVIYELETQPSCPKMILGDLNADTNDLPALENKLNSGAFVDIGAH